MDVINMNVTSTKENFWNAIKIYFNHPNSINKQILFSENILGLELKLHVSRNDCLEIYKDLCNELTKSSDLLGGLRNLQYLEFKLIDYSDIVFEQGKEMYLLVRKLIPKLHKDDCSEFYEFFFIDKVKLKLHILTKHLERKEFNANSTFEWKKQDPYIVLKYKEVEVTHNSKFLELFYDRNSGEKGINWLREVFLTKLSKLMLHNNNVNKTSNKLCFTNKVNIVQYYQLYEKIKSKYAKHLIENWTENTDPKKFVYEDIGIATYLIMLWNGGDIPKDEAKQQRFVDLGCGNGLLVYILNSEGHLGVGLDIRKRKIWDTYPSSTILKEETIIPTTDTTYPEADWLIGNHSDELTAWIPIMARRSSGHCQYFVLPCCPYQLNGRKFQRKNSSLSSYQDFIVYVKDVSEICDFDTYVDKLRIPSTKRICLIGLNKCGMSTERMKSINETVLSFVKKECHAAINDTEENIACECSNGETKPVVAPLEFKIRESVESVRNCTKLPHDVVDSILQSVTNALLRQYSVYTVTKENKTYFWNRGGKLLISELTKFINDDLLKQLKRECKGIQTLLKNHHFIFEVIQGTVQFRSPESLMRISNKCLNSENQSKWKRRSCWFNRNHPDKCPLSDDVCSYNHET